MLFLQCAFLSSCPEYAHVNALPTVMLYNEITVILFWCFFFSFWLFFIFIKVELHTVMLWFGRETECVFAFCMRGFRAAVCVWVDVIVVAPVICLCLIQSRVHIYLTADASPYLCLRIL